LDSSFFIFFGSTAYSAEITLDPLHISGKSTVHGILIEGDIKKGDYAKLHELIKNSRGGREVIYLASKGGDVLEAIKIGRLIRKFNISTEAPFYMPEIEPPFPILLAKVKKENLVCASSCFFILAAGTSRTGGIIGIHRPFFTEESYLDFSGKDAINLSLKIKELLKEYLVEMNLPTSFVDRMFEISGSRIEWLETKKFRI
jgi:hypothetical protein